MDGATIYYGESERKGVHEFSFPFVECIFICNIYMDIFISQLDNNI